jgi:hypothetical protein
MNTVIVIAKTIKKDVTSDGQRGSPQLQPSAL